MASVSMVDNSEVEPTTEFREKVGSEQESKCAGTIAKGASIPAHELCPMRASGFDDTFP
jgi:hypothetical protein